VPLTSSGGSTRSSSDGSTWAIFASFSVRINSSTCSGRMGMPRSAANSRIPQHASVRRRCLRDTTPLFERHEARPAGRDASGGLGAGRRAGWKRRVRRERFRAEKLGRRRVDRDNGAEQCWQRNQNGGEQACSNRGHGRQKHSGDANGSDEAVSAARQPDVPPNRTMSHLMRHVLRVLRNGSALQFGMLVTRLGALTGSRL
jgi:hypothetical protein